MMRKKQTVMQWDFAEDMAKDDQDQPWALVETQVDDDGRPWYQRHARVLGTLFTGIVIAGLLTGILLYRQAQAGLDELEGELWAVSVAALEPCYVDEPAAPLDSAHAGAPGCLPGRWEDDVLRSAEVVSTRFRSGQIQVILAVRNGDDTVYHVPFYYRESAVDWLPVEPTSQFLGETRELVTSSLHWRFADQEQEWIDQVAQDVDRAHRTLRVSLGLNAMPLRVLTVETAPFLPTAEEFAAALGDNRLLVPSPLVLARPAHENPASTFETYLLHGLANHALAEATITDPVLSRWQGMLYGLFLALADPSSNPLPHRRVHEEQLSLALTSDWNELLQGFPGSGVTNPAQAWAVESLAEYLVNEYGVQVLGPLVVGLRTESGWETLAPFLLGSDASTLEANWHAHAAVQGAP